VKKDDDLSGKCLVYRFKFVTEIYEPIQINVSIKYIQYLLNVSNFQPL